MYTFNCTSDNLMSLAAFHYFPASRCPRQLVASTYTFPTDANKHANVSADILPSHRHPFCEAGDLPLILWLQTPLCLDRSTTCNYPRKRNSHYTEIWHEWVLAKGLTAHPCGSWATHSAHSHRPPTRCLALSPVPAQCACPWGCAQSWRLSHKFF
jgi:hypothetical protein